MRPLPAQQRAFSLKRPAPNTPPLPLLNNTLLEQMKDIDKQVDKWQAKMSDKVDYYTNKFTQLEMLIAQMNSQSSSLAGMMGGY